MIYSDFIRVVFPYAEGFVKSQAMLNQITPEVTPEANTTEQLILTYCQQPKSRAEIQKFITTKKVIYPV